MHNTIVSVAMEGMPEWAKQGVHFCYTHGSPEHAVLDEKLKLQDFYGKAFVGQSTEEILAHFITEYKQRRGILVLPDACLQSLVEQIQVQVQMLGAKEEIMVTGLDEECERELEKEVELEKEEEVQIANREPVAEKDWAYNSIFSFSSAAQVPVAMQLSSIITTRFDRDDGLEAIKWTIGGKIYMTSNFISTVLNDRGRDQGNIAQYLRPLDNVLVFTSSILPSSLLLSEREADAILRLMWAKGKIGQGHQAQAASGAKVFLANMSCLRLAQTAPPQCVSRGITASPLACDTLAAL